MTMGLICADVQLRQQAVQQLSRLQQFQLDWFVLDAAQARAQVQVPLLLVAAGQCSPALLRELCADGRVQVVALAHSLQLDCDAIYAALDAGVCAYLELQRHPGPAELEQRLQRLRDQHCAVTQPANLPPLLAIGASAGGPAALAQVLGELPANLSAAVLVVQHFAGADIQGFCDWLQPLVRLPVRRALIDAVPRCGEVLIAQSGQHLGLSAARRLSCPQKSSAELNCPSVDVLFHSLALHAAPGVAMLLTGMGQDGAQGLLALRRTGWHTLVQDAQSSAVDGMPRAARELGAACEVLGLLQLSAAAQSALAEIAAQQP